MRSIFRGRRLLPCFVEVLLPSPPATINKTDTLSLPCRIAQDFMNAAMHYLKLSTSAGNPILRIAMGPDGTNFAFIELRTEEVRMYAVLKEACNPRVLRECPLQTAGSGSVYLMQWAS